MTPPSRSSNSSWLFLSIFYAGLLLTILFLAYTNSLPAFLGKIPYYDTVGHFVLYGMAARPFKRSA